MLVLPHASKPTSDGLQLTDLACRGIKNCYLLPLRMEITPTIVMKASPDPDALVPQTKNIQVSEAFVLIPSIYRQ
jgi:hypothetical protein